MGKEVKDARKQTGVWFSATPDGMGWMEARLPIEQCRAIENGIELLARAQQTVINDSQPTNSDPDGDSLNPTIGQLRAHVLVDAIDNLLAQEQGEHGTKQANGRKVAVVLDLPTALGLADNPGVIPGLGTIPGPLARQIAIDGVWQRWITDPQTGALLDIGRTRYTPSAKLRDLITARDQTCRYPGCTTPADTSDIDHAQSWNSAGATDRANLGALCRYHHRRKTAGTFHIINGLPDGSATLRRPGKPDIHLEPLEQLPEPNPPIDQDQESDSGASPPYSSKPKDATTIRDDLDIPPF